MSSKKDKKRLTRHPGQQGMRPSGGNQPEVDKYASGIRQKRPHGSPPADSKRSRQQSSSSADEDFPLLAAWVPSPWPRFLVIEAVDGALQKVSSIKICHQLKEIIGSHDNTKRLRSGALLVQVTSRGQSETLLKARTLFGIPVTVKPHNSLNTCKGVIQSYESVQCTEEELADWLHKQGVCHNKTTFWEAKGFPNSTVDL